MSINAAQLTAACQAFGVPVPDAVLDAEAVVTGAEELLKKVRTETAPDLNAVTGKTVTKTFEAAVTWLTHTDRERIAERMLNLWRPRVDEAWRSRIGPLCEAFRTPFDDAVADFAKAYDELAPLAGPDGIPDASQAIAAGLADAYDQYARAGAKLTQLGALREMFASEMPPDVGVSGGGASGYQHVSKVAVIASRELATQLPVILSGRRAHDPEWYVQLLRTPGIAIRWQTAEEQTKWLALGRPA